MNIETAVIALIAIAASLLLNLIFTPVLLGLSHRYGWYDEVNHRKIHTGNIPRIGGVGIFLSFLVVSVVFVLLRPFLPARLGIQSIAHYIPFLVAFLAVNLLGLIDDFSNLRARVKIIIQAAAAIVVTVFGVPFAGLYIPGAGFAVPFGPLSYLITFLWVVGICNAVNLIDGLDGLAGGITSIAALSMGVVFSIQGGYVSAFFAFALAGGIIAFLFFNMPPARLFMGDSGALFIGFALASLPLIQPIDSAPGMPIVLSVTILLVPLLDTAAAILRRLRRHTPISEPDREHIHHKLLDLGVSNRGILAIIYTIGILLGLSSIVWGIFPADGEFVWVLLAWVIAVAFFLVLDRLNRRRKSAIRERPASDR